MTRRLVRSGLFLAAPILALLVVKVFFLDIYRVDSGSMEPVIHGTSQGGEQVLVRYARNPDLRRFDLVVVLREGERVPVVKRVVGLPGEEVQLYEGDLLIDGRRLAANVPRPPLVRLFDSNLLDVAEHFELEGDWTLEVDAFVFEPSDDDEEEEEGAACWSGGLTDGRVTVDGELIAGMRQVADAAIACDVMAYTGSGQAFLSLSEEADEFRAVVELVEDEREAEVSLLRLRPNAETVLATTTVRFRQLHWHRMRLSNVDDHVALDVDGSRVLAVSYEGNTPLEGVPDPRLRHRRPRACFGGRGVGLRFGDVRLHRDLHYTDTGGFGTAEPLHLGPDEVFLLGDNSGESVDGRSWGPVRLGEVIGIPVAVIWPFHAARRLVPAAPIPAAPPQTPASQ